MGSRRMAWRRSSSCGTLAGSAAMLQGGVHDAAGLYEHGISAASLPPHPFETHHFTPAAVSAAHAIDAGRTSELDPQGHFPSAVSAILLARAGYRKNANHV